MHCSSYAGIAENSFALSRMSFCGSRLVSITKSLIHSQAQANYTRNNSSRIPAVIHIQEGCGCQSRAALLDQSCGHTCRSFEQLLATAHLHQVAQLRRLHQLRKANEAQAVLMTKLRAKSAKEEEHAAATEKHRREMSNLQKTRNAELEVRMGWSWHTQLLGSHFRYSSFGISMCCKCLDIPEAKTHKPGSNAIAALVPCQGFFG